MYLKGDTHTCIPVARCHVCTLLLPRHPIHCNDPAIPLLEAVSAGTTGWNDTAGMAAVSCTPYSLEATMNAIVAVWIERLSPDLQELWEERAAIMQFDTGLDREYAEWLAMLVVLDFAIREKRYLIWKGENHVRSNNH